MCGIAGFVGVGDTGDLARMSAALAHRGPDAEGAWSDRNGAVHLAVRRLAVVDVGRGKQPMVDPDDGLVLVYNGEIYNHLDLRAELARAGHTFSTDSDTEVVLRAYREWGVGLVERLNGMWAFAIYDRPRRRLFLSRDRFGQKPLYYSRQNGTFAFASELSSLTRHRGIHASLSRLGLQKYFAYGFIPAPASLYQDVYKLPAGSNLLIDVPTLNGRPDTYWNFVLEDPGGPPRDARDPDDALAEELRALIRQAVRRQLRSDVPVGIFLSGGLDSATITHFAAEASSTRLPTFSIGFSRADFDESVHAAAVSSSLGTDHTTVALDRAAGAGLDRLAATLDEPVADGSLICTHVLCETARRRVTVALGGEGADELLAGYDPFRALGLARLYDTLVPKPVHRAIRSVVARLPARFGYMTPDYRLKRTLRGLTYPPALWNPVWIGPIEPSEFAGLFDEPADIETVYSEAIELWDGSDTPGLVERTMQFYVRLYLQNGILAKVDRAGMMNSLEVRSPFLDLDLVNFIRRLPTSLKIRNGSTKYLLKRAMRPLLPRAVVDRPKHGFAVPLAEWFRDGSLNVDPAALPPGLNAEFARRRLASHREGRENNGLLLWALWLLGHRT